MTFVWTSDPFDFATRQTRKRISRVLVAKVCHEKWKHIKRTTLTILKINQIPLKKWCLMMTGAPDRFSPGWLYCSDISRTLFLYLVASILGSIFYDRTRESGGNRAYVCFHVLDFTCFSGQGRPRKRKDRYWTLNPDNFWKKTKTKRKKKKQQQQKQNKTKQSKTRRMMYFWPVALVRIWYFA